MSSVKLESRPGLGNVLVANRDFQPGETVVHERPLLHVPQLKPSNPLYKPLQAYFQDHQVPPSVVLKVMAFVMARSTTQASVLRCFCPDTTAHADAAVVQQARAFAACLLQHPPVPELAAWAEQQCTPAAQAAQPQPHDEGLEERQTPAQLSVQGVRAQDPEAFDVLVRVWLIWVMNGHNFQLGSALFDYGSKLTHTCAQPSTMYRTAKGDIAAVVETVDGSGGGGGGLRQQQPAAASAAVSGAGAAGVHVALHQITAGDMLTTNYLGMGHKRVMSTPARQKYLSDKFLFKCTCSRCTREVDTARGIPCPVCSGPHRAQDKLLLEQEALPDWQLGQGFMDTPPSTGSDTGSTSSTATGGDPGAQAAAAAAAASGAGYVYCDMAALLSGQATPWKCDKCNAVFADDTAELWGRFYTKSYATIEAEMEGWVNRLDASLDTAPLVRDPTVLHQRVLGVLRLLGPRHWASWRLLLLGVELHCGAMEEASLKMQLRRRRSREQQQQQQQQQQAEAAPQQHAGESTGSEAQASAATAAAAGPSGPAAEQAPAGRSTGSSSPPDAGAPSADDGPVDPAATAFITQLAVWIVRYCRQLWRAVAGKFGVEEAGQVLGYHFIETSQVLLQVASSPGVLDTPTAHSLVEAALQMQLLVLPGLRSIMGPSYNPLADVLGPGSTAAAGAAGESGQGQASVCQTADAATVAAAVRRQMRQQQQAASQMLSLVQELKQLETQEGAG